MSMLQERLEKVRPECPHGRKIKSLLYEAPGCAGSIKPCQCCENPTCKASGRHSPWLCRECEAAS